MDFALSHDDLVELTGYKRPADQARALRESFGITPFVSRTGRITVFLSVLEEAQKRRSGFEVEKVTRRGPRPRLARQ